MNGAAPPTHGPADKSPDQAGPFHVADSRTHFRDTEFRKYS